MSPSLCTNSTKDDACIPMQVHRRDTQHLDVHVAQLTTWELQYDQLDPGLFEAEFVDIGLPWLQLFRERTNRALWQRGELTPGAFGVAVMQFHDPAAGAWAHVDVICSPGNELDFRTPSDCTMLGLVVDQTLLLSTCGAAIEHLDPTVLSPHRRLGTGPTTAASARFAQQIGGLIETVLTHPSPFADTRVLAQIRDAALSYCVPLLEGAPLDKLRPSNEARRRVVERAKALMMAEEDEPPSLLDICKRLGVSQRKLTYCFQDVTGMSPHHCMRVIRLNAARRQLAGLIGGPEQSVRDIAHRWGFWHFGRFSLDYKRHFDESPSQTLRRRLS